MLSLAITVARLVAALPPFLFALERKTKMTTAPLSKKYANREPFNLDALHPIMKIPVRKLIAATAAHPFMLGGLSASFYPFEGFRHPLRQHYLVTETKNTKAGPWESAHQYGLAVDFAVLVVDDDSTDTLWSWSAQAPWGELKRLASVEGLTVPIAWDQGHVQHPIFKTLTLR